MISLLRRLHLSYFSSPAADRCLYRAIRRQRTARILEIGVGMGIRATRMIGLAAHFRPAAEVRYAGIDLFESGDTNSGTCMTLKGVYRRVKRTGAMVRLLPGDPYSALARSANDLVGTDLVVISPGTDPEALSRAWFYVPRLLHDGSAVFLQTATERPGRYRTRLVPRQEIDELAGPEPRRRAA